MLKKQQMKVSMSKENPNICAQLYVYERKSLLPLLLRCITALCSDGGEWSLKGLSTSGVKHIKKYKSLTDLFGKIPAKFPNGFNQLEIVESGSSELLAKRISAVKFVYTPSPSNKDWAQIGEVQSEQYTRPVRQMLMSLLTLEDFVSIKRLKRHPGFLSIKVWSDEAKDRVSRKTVLRLFKGMIHAVADEYSDGYIGYIDPRLVPPADSLMGGKIDQAQRMDAFLDMPHMVVFGPNAILQKYAGDMIASYPKLDMISETVGSATIVAFKDREEISKVYLPEWHFLHP